ncbi:hypothetical protein O6H91_Y562700 [Diphasiastrum complanatum]|nr:hypothetical protein O6H91_Y562700 [Diphasiastrum complanatum]
MGWFWIETPLMTKGTREFFCHFNFARNCSGKWLHGWLNFHLVAASNRSQCWEASVNGLHQLLPPNKPLNGRSCLNPKSRPKHQFVEKRMEEEQVDLSEHKGSGSTRQKA